MRLPLLAKVERASLKPSSNLGVLPGYPKMLYQLERFRSRCVLDPSDAYPGAEELAARLITVPTHDKLGERDLDRLEAWLQSPA